MRIETSAEKILYCTVRLETEGPEPNQIGAGTAFVFALQTERGNLPCLVTNKHVISGAQAGRFFFTAGIGNKPNVGERFDITMDNFEARWYGHPDPQIDVATMPLGPLLHKASEMGKEVFYSYIDQTLIPTAEQLEDLDVLEEVTFVGYLRTDSGPVYTFVTVVAASSSFTFRSTFPPTCRRILSPSGPCSRSSRSSIGCGWSL